jgi:hypothetical protein
MFAKLKHELTHKKDVTTSEKIVRYSVQGPCDFPGQSEYPWHLVPDEDGEIVLFDDIKNKLDHA